jgi:hypothetical protein
MEDLLQSTLNAENANISKINSESHSVSFSAPLFTLRIRTPTETKIINSVTPDTTMFQLQTVINQLTGIPFGNQKILVGFPPKELILQLDEPIKHKIKHNDTLIIDIRNSALKTPPVTMSDSVNINNTEIIHIGGEEKKRKAESNSSKENATKKQKTNTKTATNSGTLTNRIHTLFERPTARSGADKTLRGTKKTRGKPIKTKESLEKALIGAAQSRVRVKSTGDLAMDYLKAAMKEALQTRQSESLAHKRYEAALLGNYEFQSLPVYRLGDNYQPRYIVRFKTSPKIWNEETHEDFELSELKAILADVLATAGDQGRELLKPYKMALASPRVFWSMVKHFNGDIIRGLHELFPEVNWDFVDERKRNLSEKAEENRQLEERMQKELAEKMRRRKERAKLLQELREQGESTDGIVIEGLGSHDTEDDEIAIMEAILDKEEETEVSNEKDEEFDPSAARKPQRKKRKANPKSKKSKDSKHSLHISEEHHTTTQEASERQNQSHSHSQGQVLYQREYSSSENHMETIASQQQLEQPIQTLSNTTDDNT